MKFEDEPRPGVNSEEIEEVLLRDGHWYPVRDNSFRIYSPVEAGHRARSGNQAGAYLRFRNQETGMWIEAPLSSLVAVGYPDPERVNEIRKIREREVANSQTDGGKGK